jgi:hypothetical protein
MGNAC